MTKIDEMMANPSQYHGTFLHQVDVNHRIMQVALDQENVFIVPQYRNRKGTWNTYTRKGETVFFKRVSSGYYQLQSAKTFVERSLGM